MLHSLNPTLYSLNLCTEFSAFLFSLSHFNIFLSTFWKTQVGRWRDTLCIQSVSDGRWRDTLCIRSVSDGRWRDTLRIRSVSCINVYFYSIAEIRLEYELDDSQFDPGRDKRLFSTLPRSPLCSPSLLFYKQLRSFPGLKRPGRDVFNIFHLPPSNHSVCRRGTYNNTFTCFHSTKFYGRFDWLCVLGNVTCKGCQQLSNKVLCFGH
jgi:hypothetical protein